MNHAASPLFLRLPSPVGLLLGLVFFALSLSPTLIPRPPLLQGLLSGVALAAGYAVGVTGRWIWEFLQIPEASLRLRRALLACFGLAAAGLALGFLLRASVWQDSVRILMDLPPVESTRPLSVGLVALAVFALLLLLARIFRWLKRRIARLLAPLLPPRVALMIGAVTTLILFWLVISGLLARFVLGGFDASFQQLDRYIEDTLAAPSDPQRSGGRDSLTDWYELGRQGRRFIADTPTRSALERVGTTPVVEPIRVYVGLNSADTIASRVALAMAELERTGAFSREILLVVTPTGTGWVDPGAVRSLEYLWRGNVASVAVQYSYLPSWLSLLAQPEYGEETARALFAAVYARWHTLPKESRPRLYLFGLSLGALNSERSADIWDMIDDPIGGALWSGPPFRSRTWRWASQQRRPDSPAWLPRFRDGAVIRFANQHGGLEDFEAPWGSFRIAYLQYASDPISFFRPEAALREPDWLRAERGPDVSPFLRWYPVITFLQLLADIAAADAAPLGYGHAFATEHYLRSWYALTEPSGWDPEQLRQLERLIGDLTAD